MAKMAKIGKKKEYVLMGGQGVHVKSPGDEYVWEGHNVHTSDAPKPACQYLMVMMMMIVNYLIIVISMSINIFKIKIIILILTPTLTLEYVCVSVTGIYIHGIVKFHRWGYTSEGE